MGHPSEFATALSALQAAPLTPVGAAAATPLADPRFTGLAAKLAAPEASGLVSSSTATPATGGAP